MADIIKKYTSDFHRFYSSEGIYRKKVILVCLLSIHIQLIRENKCTNEN